MILLYQTIEWTTGDASEGTDGIGGISACAGASSGSGDGSVTLQGSGTSSVLQLSNMTNNEEPGVFVFRIDTTSGMDIHFFQPPCHPGANANIECNSSPSYPDAQQAVTKQQQQQQQQQEQQQASETLNKQQQEQMVKEIEQILEQLLDSSNLTGR